MKVKLLAGYIFYFFSYLLIYLPSFPIMVFIIMAGDDPTKEHTILDAIIMAFEILVTIIGSWTLNYIFRRLANLKRNTKYSWTVFVLHLILIPLTWRILIDLL